jgi:uncharacterized membrane protein YeaQ/YmgE (transglycosylase-associated protein family)
MKDARFDRLLAGIYGTHTWRVEMFGRWVTIVIVGALAGWFTGRTLRTGDLVVVDVVLGVAGALLGGFILSSIVESTSNRVLFTLVAATAGGAVPVWLLHLKHRAS